jgi:hypothetical protein
MVTLQHSIRGLFQAAGWAPGRQIPVSSSVPREHPAWDVLSEFQHLHVGSTGAGEECARGDVQFDLRAVSDPLAEAWQIELGTTLICIGEVHHGHSDLFISEEGRIFSSSIVHPAFMMDGRTFEEALERILLGRRPWPMLLPDQSFVTLFGEDIYAGDPRVIAPPYILAK